MGAGPSMTVPVIDWDALHALIEHDTDPDPDAGAVEEADSVPLIDRGAARPLGGERREGLEPLAPGGGEWMRAWIDMSDDALTRRTPAEHAGRLARPELAARYRRVTAPGDRRPRRLPLRRRLPWPTDRQRHARELLDDRRAAQRELARRAGKLRPEDRGRRAVSGWTDRRGGR